MSGGGVQYGARARAILQQIPRASVPQFGGGCRVSVRHAESVTSTIFLELSHGLQRGMFSRVCDQSRRVMRL